MKTSIIGLSFCLFLTLVDNAGAFEPDISQAGAYDTTKALITGINTIAPNQPLTDVEMQMYVDLPRLNQKAFLSGAFRKQIKIATLPQEIMQRHDDTTAQWLMLIILNGHNSYISDIRELAQFNCIAQSNLGFCYQYGKGVAKDFAEAVKWYQLAADHGEAGAQTNLGHCYKMGEGVAKDLVVAVKWYQLAADHRYARAQFHLGWCYHFGQGVAKDFVEAVKWYHLAADQGSAGAQNNLGYCYSNGQGVEKDLVVAVKLYRLAADQGAAMAQYNLGDCYECGEGVEKDLVVAVKLYILSANQGNDYARRALGRLIELKRNSPRQELLTEEITENINTIHANVEEIYGDALYWIGLSHNAPFKDCYAPMPILGAKAKALAQFYHPMFNVLPLLKNPSFAISCFGFKDSKLKPYLETYQDTKEYYLSFDPTYRNFKKDYDQTVNSIFTHISEMREWSHMIDSLLLPNGENVGARLEKVKRQETPETFQFIEPLFCCFDKEIPTEEQPQESVRLKEFMDDFRTRIDNHLTFFTNMGTRCMIEAKDDSTYSSVMNIMDSILVPFNYLWAPDSSPLLSSMGFKEMFETLVVETAPYRNHLFLNKYEKLIDNGWF